MTPRKEKPPAMERVKAGIGIECRGCGCRQFYVVFVRHFAGCVRRTRECRNCGRRLVTKEEVTLWR